MTAMYELEQMGYRFRLDGERVLMRKYGSAEAPARAKELIAKLDREQVRNALKDRAEGFSVAPAGIIFAKGNEIMPIALKIRAALDSGELWDIFVKYSRSADTAEFHYWPAEWQLTI